MELALYYKRDGGTHLGCLVSFQATFITGHSLVVDGGLTIQLQEDLGVRQARFIRQHPEIELPP